MNELIPSEGQPSAVSVSRTEVKPIQATDKPSSFRKFINALRTAIGSKPVEVAQELAVRYGEAKVREKEIVVENQEVENEIKLLKAKQEYELVQAEIRRKELEAQGELELAQAEAAKIRAEARSEKAIAEITKAAAKAIALSQKTPEEAMAEVQRIVEKIRSLGGDVEIKRPRKRKKKTDDGETPKAK